MNRKHYYLLVIIAIAYGQTAFGMRALAAKQKQVAVTSSGGQFFEREDVRQMIEKYATRAFERLKCAFGREADPLSAEQARALGDPSKADKVPTHDDLKKLADNQWKALAEAAQNEGIKDLQRSNAFVLKIYKDKRDEKFKAEVYHMLPQWGADSFKDATDKRQKYQFGINKINNELQARFEQLEQPRYKYQNNEDMKKDAISFATQFLNALVRNAQQEPYPIDIKDIAVIKAVEKTGSQPEKKEEPARQESPSAGGSEKISMQQQEEIKKYADTLYKALESAYSMATEEHHKKDLFGNISTYIDGDPVVDYKYLLWGKYSDEKDHLYNNLIGTASMPLNEVNDIVAERLKKRFGDDLTDVLGPIVNPKSVESCANNITAKIQGYIGDLKVIDRSNSLWNQIAVYPYDDINRGITSYNKSYQKTDSSPLKVFKAVQLDDDTKEKLKKDALEYANGLLGALRRIVDKEKITLKTPIRDLTDATFSSGSQQKSAVKDLNRLPAGTTYKNITADDIKRLTDDGLAALFGLKRKYADWDYYEKDPRNPINQESTPPTVKKIYQVLSLKFHSDKAGTGDVDAFQAFDKFYQKVKDNF